MVIALIAVQAIYEPRSTKELTGEVKPVGLSEKECYLEAIWYESRNQSYQGMHKVAEVIYNRTQSGIYPDTACKVIKQDKQFSYKANIPLEGSRIVPKPSEYEAYTQALAIAENASKGRLEPSMPTDTLWYARFTVKNYWTKTMQKVQQYKEHVFYRKKEKS